MPCHAIACRPPELQEISRAIGQSWTDANEEDLLKELAGLEAEEEQEQQAAVAAAPVAAPAPAAARPAAPSAEPSSLEQDLPEAPVDPVVLPTGRREEAAEDTRRPTAVPA